ncbi:uncharacterized protein BX663DRAFT_555379 [Cokeromyces recurvatus]|uniref:uncharacterized protein n=1 Tax=Cokeromyces recurvatus TaxID=90255 RepID=UPI00221F7F96|nr:uncharacterized protein BX663DRAFT_555379 [Cokeromyces recurvatus]KAI7899054.1 hypothetical protein BX663DRAFT_555379 [Cokeromyces recurvatus]
MSSSFHFINQASPQHKQGDATLPTALLLLDTDDHSPPKHKQPKWTSSSLFILEEAFDDISYSPSSDKDHSQQSEFQFINNHQDNKDNSTFPSFYKASSLESNSFMNQIDKSNKSSSPSLMTPSPKMKQSKLLKTDNEMKLLHTSITFQKLEKQKQEAFEAIKRIYQQQNEYPIMINQLKELKRQIQEAVSHQDFNAAQQYKLQSELIQSRLKDMLIGGRKSENDLLFWKEKMERYTGELSQRIIHDLVSCYHDIKQERTRQLNQYLNQDTIITATTTTTTTTTALHHTQQLLEQERMDLQSVQSEIVFDLDIWKQNETDLTSRMEEVVQMDMEHKSQLVTKSKEIENDILKLQRQLEQLEIERQETLKEIKKVDKQIEIKLKPFEEERQQFEEEKRLIELRQEEIKEKIFMLDIKDNELEAEIKQYQNEIKRRQDEIGSIENQIKELLDKQAQYSQENKGLSELVQLIHQHQTLHMTQYQEDLKEDQHTLQNKKRALKILQEKECKDEERYLKWQETVIKQTNKLKGLKKCKEIAIDNDEFERAAQLSYEINSINLKDIKEKEKMAEIQVQKIKEDIKEMKIEISQLTVEISNKKDNFVRKMEKELNELKEKLLKLLSNEESVSMVKTMVEFEIETVNMILSNCQDLFF